MRAWLARLGLWFPAEDDERAFSQAFIVERLPQTRLYMVAASVIYYAFLFWDWLLEPVSWSATIAIRSVIVFGWMLPLVGLTLVPRMRRHAEAILLLFTVIPVWSLSVIYSYLRDGYDHGTAGTILLILYVATLLPMRASVFALFSLATWAGFVTGEILFVNQPTGHYVVNNISVGTALLLSLYSVAAREFAARQQFRTAVELRAAKEASDTALADLKSAQARLVHAEKLASLGQLVAGVAHEINTPIGMAITTATAFEADVTQIRQGAESGQLRRSELTGALARLTEGSRILFSNLNRAADLIHGFKQVAVDRATETQRSFPVSAWLHELLTSLQPLIRRQGHTVETHCPDDLTIETYPGALAQIVSNLAMNAMTHAFAGERPGRIVIEVSRRGEHGIRIVFHDDGRGIAPEHLGKVFDPFFTTRRNEGGTGLGLHIVYNLVTGVLGGEVSLTSEVGRGTRFCIDLPVRVDAASPRIALPV